MIPSNLALAKLDPDRFWKWSRALLVGGFAVLIGLVLWGAWSSTTLILAIGALMLGGLALNFLARDEVLLLCAILAGFVVVVRYKEGFQVEEVLYGLLYMGYLAYWFVSRIWLYLEEFLRTALDWALLLFLVYVTLSLPLTLLLEGAVNEAVSQWLSVTMLAFYFPIKEVCIRRRDRLPQKWILLSLGFVALFIVIRNLVDYKIGLSQAEHLWQIATGRVVMNEHVLLMAGLVALTVLVHARGWANRAILTGLLSLFSAGIVIGQSRALWLAFGLGVAIIFFFVDRKQRIHIVLLGFLGLASLVLVGAMVFDNFFSVIVAGLTDRFFSLQTATTKDISLINRFVEMEAAWDFIRKNPIVGYGFGVPIHYYNLQYEATYYISYIHNGFLGVWYRHGLLGFCLLYFFYVGSIWIAFRTARHHAADRLDRIIAIAAVAFLVAESLVGNAANPFATSDTTLVIAAMAGLAAASRHHTEQKTGSIQSPSSESRR